MTEYIDTLAERSKLISRCVRCSHCKFVATPKSHKFASACPSMDWGQFHSYSASGQMIAGQALIEGKAAPSAEFLKAVYSCTMCGACDTSCKINLGEMIEPLESLQALRAHLVQEGHSPQSHKTLVRNLAEHGNRLGLPRQDRSLWAEGLALDDRPVGSEGVFLHVGDELPYEKQQWQSARTIVRALEGAGVKLAFAGAAEGSCGGLAFDLGYVREARDMAKALWSVIHASGAGTVVTFSAQAFAAFRALYPRLGIELGDVRVLHISEYLEKLCEDERIVLDPIGSGRATYHDPCKLGRLSEPWHAHDRAIDVKLGYYVSRERAALRFGNNGCYDAPRQLITRLGFELVELERSRVSSYCCGGGGGALEQSPDAALNAARSRLDEIASVDAALCITACGGCKSHLANADSGTASGIHLADLLDLVARAIRHGIAE